MVTSKPMPALDPVIRCTLPARFAASCEVSQVVALDAAMNLFGIMTVHKMSKCIAVNKCACPAEEHIPAFAVSQSPFAVPLRQGDQ